MHSLIFQTLHPSFNFWDESLGAYLIVSEEVARKRRHAINVCNLTGRKGKMIKKWIYAALVLIVLGATNLYAQDYSLPYPPREFFEVLATTPIPCGPDNCHNARSILVNSVMISPYLAVNLYKAGKIYIGDARPLSQIMGNRILGALILPVDKVDFMELKPNDKPIALYWNWRGPTDSSRVAVTLYKRGFKHVVLIDTLGLTGTEVLHKLGLPLWVKDKGVIFPKYEPSTAKWKIVEMTSEDQVLNFDLFICSLSVEGSPLLSPFHHSSSSWMSWTEVPFFSSNFWTNDVLQLFKLFSLSWRCYRPVLHFSTPLAKSYAFVSQLLFLRLVGLAIPVFNTYFYSNRLSLWNPNISSMEFLKEKEISIWKPLCKPHTTWVFQVLEFFWRKLCCSSVSFWI